MTPQFLRSEAARFREMADGVTDREASRQRLLNMATDYESRANAADMARSSEPDPIPESEPADNVADVAVPTAEVIAPAPGTTLRARPGRKSILRP
jgi:hypothetical protein